MQLISLNLWGGRAHDPLLKFINKHKENTDFFTFQEALKHKENILTGKYHANILGEIAEALPNHKYYFSPRAKNHNQDGKVDIPLEFGQATFVKENIKIIEQKEIFVYKTYNLTNKYFEDGHVDFPSLFIQTILKVNSKKLMILNFHGLWTMGPKTDTEHRLRQSQIIIDHIQFMNLPTILAGDFNLRMESKSLKMFQDAGLKNLVKEFNIPTTRSRFYEEKWRKIDKYADYIFTTNEINVKSFNVLKNEVSDHLPLLINFKV